MTTTPGLAEAIAAVARFNDDELISIVIGGQARAAEATELGHDVDAQTATFYLGLALAEIERRCQQVVA